MAQLSTLSSILSHWYRQQLTAAEIEQLIKTELADKHRCKAFRIDRANCQEKLEARSQLFKLVATPVVQWCKSQGFERQEDILLMLWRLWLPLAMQLDATRNKLGRTSIEGILGGQGTGKSTLASILKLILNQLGHSVAILSIDDLYLTYAERQQLQQQDPRLIWRGPPGTHDVNLGLQVIERCLSANTSEPILLPRFDKSAFEGAGDRTTPEAIEKIDILLFEGWFVGVQPIDDRVFENPLEPITTSEDCQFARDNNRRLKAYLPLWEKLDSLIVLNPVDYRLSQQWRKEAEQKMKQQGKTGMSDAEIDRFVEYFWQALHPELFIAPLINNRNLVNLVIEIERDRSIGKIY
ncbi:glycerate kinase [Myxosarcina sp. GI1]|uniref:glycerate kinase n=1 Tax=Myxosarcina sp. GI1 TaxID=1541065 RepID=UPI00068C8B13|nr:glycerate kinase [Myxosarcina sp. GI1]